MSLCTVRELCGFFESYGWNVAQSGDNILSTGWVGQSRLYRMQVSLNSTLIDFEVNPLLCTGLDWYQWPEILLFLMDLNYQSKFVKLAISEAGLIVLSASVLADGFTSDSLARTLEILGYYCDTLFDSISSQLARVSVQHSNPSLLLT